MFLLFPDLQNTVERSGFKHIFHVKNSHYFSARGGDRSVPNDGL